MRMVECRYVNGTIATTSLCNQHLGPAPSDQEKCTTSRDCSVECEDLNSLEFCSLVRSSNMCHMENLRQQCCKTCQETGIV